MDTRWGRESLWMMFTVSFRVYPTVTTRITSISNLDGSVIYYAASQTKENAAYIPNDKGDWIAVHGEMPPPDIFPDTTKESTPPREDLVFGNDSEKQEEDKPMKPALQPIAEDENVQENEQDEDESLSQLD